jgi:hypothetical protein
MITIARVFIFRAPPLNSDASIAPGAIQDFMIQKKGPPHDREGLLMIYLLSLAYFETVKVTAEALALMEYLEVVPL